MTTPEDRRMYKPSVSQTFGEKYDIKSDGKHRPNGSYAGYYVTYVPYPGADRVRLLVTANGDLVTALLNDLRTR